MQPTFEQSVQALLILPSYNCEYPKKTFTFNFFKHCLNKNLSLRIISNSVLTAMWRPRCTAWPHLFYSFQLCKNINKQIIILAKYCMGKMWEHQN